MTRQIPRTMLVAAALLIFTTSSFGSTLRVANNGLDGPTCGAKNSPCRSISHAIARAAPGDKIVVGPGTYGDLNGNGVLGEAGEETPAPGCGCMLAVNKGVSLTSSDGAAETIIDGRTVGGANGLATVLLVMDGGEFGRPGKGFTVTNTFNSDGAGIVIDSGNIAVRGNQIVATFANFSSLPSNVGGTGIDTVNFPETILIEGNQVMGWALGIRAQGAGKTLRGNKVSLNRFGIVSFGANVVTSNVVSDSGTAFDLGDQTSARGNAAYGNTTGLFVATGAVPTVFDKGNFVGNQCGFFSKSAGTTNATDDYWGAVTGPGPLPAESDLRWPDHGGTDRKEALQGEGGVQAVTTIYPRTGSIGVTRPSAASMISAASSVLSSAKRSPVRITPTGNPPTRPAGTQADGRPSRLAMVTQRMSSSVARVFSSLAASQPWANGSCVHVGVNTRSMPVNHCCQSRISDCRVSSSPM